MEPEIQTGAMGWKWNQKFRLVTGFYSRYSVVTHACHSVREYSIKIKTICSNTHAGNQLFIWDLCSGGPNRIQV